MHPPLDSADAVVKDRRDAVLTNQPSSVLGRLALGQVWRQPLPALGWSDRLLVRGINVFSRRQIRAVHGLENLTGTPDPMVVALNHSIRRETVLVIGLLVFLRGGRLIHI
ncbi:MAG: hypothetical protein GY953_50915, partial [bacterium]|nr:hypothetical protein [bacterium]